MGIERLLSGDGTVPLVTRDGVDTVILTPTSINTSNSSKLRYIACNFDGFIGLRVRGTLTIPSASFHGPNNWEPYPVSSDWGAKSFYISARVNYNGGAGYTGQVLSDSTDWRRPIGESTWGEVNFSPDAELWGNADGNFFPCGPFTSISYHPECGSSHVLNMTARLVMDFSDGDINFPVALKSDGTGYTEHYLANIMPYQEVHVTGGSAQYAIETCKSTGSWCPADIFNGSALEEDGTTPRPSIAASSDVVSAKSYTASYPGYTLQPRGSGAISYKENSWEHHTTRVHVTNITFKLNLHDGIISAFTGTVE